jgi:hypothetical protein
LKNFHWYQRSLLVVACTSLVAQAEPPSKLSHQAENPKPTTQNSSDVKAAPAVKPFMALETAADGSVVRTLGDKNLNGVRETFVNWDECASNAELVGQVTWDYSQTRESASMPTKKDDMVPCTKRRISEAFANFLNMNMKYCIAVAAMPSTQLHVIQAMAAIKKAHGSGYKTKSAKDGRLVVDEEMKTSLGTFMAKNSAAIDKEVESISQVKLLHQGIAGDNNHGSKSYHSARAMRAIDMSHFQVVRNVKNDEGKVITTTKLFQHNVASYAEKEESAGRAEALTDEQTSQHAFWQAYGACIQQKGGAVISYCSQHTGAGLKHQGHMHVSLPYDPPGSYNSK